MTSQPNGAGPRTRLASRLVQATTLATGSALLLAGVILVLVAHYSFRSALLEDIQTQAKITADNSAAALLFRDGRDAQQTLNALHASRALLGAALLDQAGEPLAVYARDPAQDGVTVVPESIRDGGHLFADGRLYVSQPVHAADGPRLGTVFFVASLTPLHQRVAGYAATTVLAALCALAVAYALVRRLRRAMDRTEERLEYLAHFDPVTGLLNRHAAAERLAFMIEKVQRFGGGVGLMLIDLDNFKYVNDTIGHDAGDQLLAEVGRRLTRCLRHGDLVCRLGGDEFMVIGEDLGDVDAARAIGDKVVHALTAPMQVAGQEVYVTGSIGMALCPRDGGDAAGLTRAADVAMYSAKGKGKNTFVLFDPMLQVEARTRLQLETDLRRAIERSEFEVFYQPIFDIGRERLAGVEALLRWQHPTRGLIAPSAFVVAAEESGMIVDIGDWVLRTACAQVQAWRAGGLGPVSVSVNVSARQLRRGRLLASVAEALEASRLPPSALLLEITEHTLVENVRANIEALQALRERGVHLAIDDFGTGLSSLGYLKRLPINALKVDRSFVLGLPDDRDDAAIVSAIIAMAKRLGLKVVAEGVEQPRQLEYLRAQGCDFAQGYLLGRPQPPAEIEALLRRGPDEAARLVAAF